MVQNDWKSYALFFIFIILFVFFVTDPQIVGYVTVERVDSGQANLSISLEDNLVEGEVIDGTFAVQLLNSVPANASLIVHVDSTDYTFPLISLLSNLTVSYTDQSYISANGALEKTITFSSPGSALLGVEVPRYADVVDFAFSVVGGSSVNSFPSSVTIDVGNDGTVDWRYLGALSSYGSEITSPDLDQKAEATTFLQTTNSYFCEYLSVPLTKNVNISVDYSKVGSPSGLKAVVLSVPTGSPKDGWAGGSDTCSLSTKSCIISLTYPIDGKYLVCVSSDNVDSSNYYVFPTDTSALSTTSYNCPKDESSLCDSLGYTNFFIRMFPGQYSSTLNGQTTSSAWETFPSAVETALASYVGSEPYKGVCENDQCLVPINVTTLSAGTVTVKDLILSYYFNGLLQSSNRLSDVLIEKEQIRAIDGKALDDGVRISFPLSVLNISVPKGSAVAVMVQLFNLSSSDITTVISLNDVQSAQEMLDNGIERYAKFTDSSTEEYNVLVMTGEISSVRDALADLNKYNQQSVFFDEKELKDKVLSAIGDLPWDITFLDGTGVILSREDLPEEFSSLAGVENMDSFVRIQARKRPVMVKYYNGSQQQNFLYTFDVGAIRTFNDATMYIAAPISFSDFSFTPRPKTFSGTSGRYSISLDNGEVGTYYFLSAGDFLLDDFTVVLLPSEEKNEEPISTTNISTTKTVSEQNGLSVWFVLIPVVLVALLILLFLRKKIFARKV